MKRAALLIIPLVILVILTSGCDTNQEYGRASTEKKTKVNFEDCDIVLRGRTVVFYFRITNDLIAPTKVRVVAEIEWEENLTNRQIQKAEETYRVPVGGELYQIEIPLHARADPARLTLLTANLRTDIDDHCTNVLVNLTRLPE